MGRALENNRRACAALFSVYVFIVLKLTVFRFHTHYSERTLNSAFFTDLLKIYQNGGTGLFFRLFLGNIGWFIPFGFLLPALLKKHNLARVALCGFLFSFSIEASQFFFRKGVAELDDLILNTLGAVIGYSLFRWSKR